MIKEKTSTQELLDAMDASMVETKRTLDLNGIAYDLGEWVTIAEYAKRFGIADTSKVSNWISRGTIPANNVIEVPELNGLRLVKAVPYR
ncbi:hypothetical protein [Larkinella sp. C7]|uniref:hypothetical protein n=1 Tax=Larkinella sp. C7 TaxID=2576607 RepID=UPI0011112BC1|nr:hypothetical protein [Larkinella sp. C7]